MTYNEEVPGGRQEPHEHPGNRPEEPRKAQTAGLSGTTFKATT